MIPRDPTSTERLRTWGHLWATTFVGLVVAVLLATRASELAGRLTLGAGAGVAVAFLMAVGLVDGLIVGGAQWMALARFMAADQRSRWLTASALGMGGAWALALGIGAAADSLLDPGSAWVAIAALLGGAAIGALIGGAQWWALRPTFTGPAGLIGASALGWCLTIVPVFVAAPGLLAGRMQPSDVVSVVTFGSLSAALGSGVVAVGLEALVRRRRPDLDAVPQKKPPRRLADATPIPPSPVWLDVEPAPRPTMPPPATPRATVPPPPPVAATRPTAPQRPRPRPEPARPRPRSSTPPPRGR